MGLQGGGECLWGGWDERGSSDDAWDIHGLVSSAHAWAGDFRSEFGRSSVRRFGALKRSSFSQRVWAMSWVSVLVKVDGEVWAALDNSEAPMGARLLWEWRYWHEKLQYKEEIGEWIRCRKALLVDFQERFSLAQGISRSASSCALSGLPAGPNTEDVVSTKWALCWLLQVSGSNRAGSPKVPGSRKHIAISLFSHLCETALVRTGGAGDFTVPLAVGGSAV